MKSFFKKYLWVFEFLGVAVIITLGILAKVYSQVVFYYIIGLALIIFGIFRVIPLVKTTKDKLLKLIYVLEIILDIIAGFILILEAGKPVEEYNNNLLRIMVGGVFFIRGAIYFYATAIRNESTDHVKFFTHLALITLGPIIVTNPIFDDETLGWIVLVIAILSAIFISISGFKNYKNYRYEQLAKDETKRVQIKEKEKEVVIERKEDPAPIKQDVVIPEEEKHEEIIS